MRDKRAGALIIQDKKLLLVTNDSTEFYWTPGGRLELDETFEEALHRELDEELCLKIKSFKPYLVTKHDDTINAHYFLVEVSGQPKSPSDEVTGFKWFSKTDFESNNYKISHYVTDAVLLELIKDGLV